MMMHEPFEENNQYGEEDVRDFNIKYPALSGHIELQNHPHFNEINTFILHYPGLKAVTCRLLNNDLCSSYDTAEAIIEEVLGNLLVISSDDLVVAYEHLGRIVHHLDSKVDHPSFVVLKILSQLVVGEPSDMAKQILMNQDEMRDEDNDPIKLLNIASRLALLVSKGSGTESLISDARHELFYKLLEDSGLDFKRPMRFGSLTAIKAAYDKADIATQDNIEWLLIRCGETELFCKRRSSSLFRSQSQTGQNISNLLNYIRKKRHNMSTWSVFFGVMSSIFSLNDRSSEMDDSRHSVRSFVSINELDDGANSRFMGRMLNFFKREQEDEHVVKDYDGFSLNSGCNEGDSCVL